MIYKQNDKDIYHNSIYQFLKSFISIIKNQNNKILFDITDDILYNSLNKITNINTLNYDTFISLNIPMLQSLQNYMKEILKQFKQKYNINKPLEKLNIIYTINHSLKEKKFSRLLIGKYINKEKGLSKMNDIFKDLYRIFIIFTQFFLEKEKFNEENIDLYLIYIFILIDFKKHVYKVKIESKNNIIKNIEYIKLR